MSLLGLDDTVIKPITGMVGDLGKTAENLATDRNTVRHQLDMTSPFKLPHLIRPISLIWGWSLKTMLDLLIVVLAFKYMEDPTVAIIGVVTSTATPLTMMLKYYFQGRTEEKNAAKNAKANIALKEMELEHDLKLEELSLKEEFKDNKVERKNNKVRLIDRVRGKRGKDEK